MFCAASGSAAVRNRLTRCLPMLAKAVERWGPLNG